METISRNSDFSKVRFPIWGTDDDIVFNRISVNGFFQNDFFLRFAKTFCHSYVVLLSNGRILKSSKSLFAQSLVCET